MDGDRTNTKMVASHLCAEIYPNRYGRYELIVRPNDDGTFTHVTESINMGTLNRGNNPITHFYRDVIPYFRYGNTPE